MTLRSKNRIYTILFVFSLAAFVLSVAALVISSLTGKITPPSNYVRVFSFAQNKILFTYRFAAAVVSILVFSVAAPILSLSVLKGFEKTPAQEVVFFTGFIVSCITESLRLNLPVYGIWESNSLFLIFIGKAVVGGRLLACLSLFFTAALSSPDDMQNTERNLLILFVSACTFAVFYPIDTTKVSSTCCVLWGYRKFFSVSRVIIFVVTCACIVTQAYSNSMKEGYKKLLGFVMIVTGNFILTNTDCWVELVVAVPILAFGFPIFLRSVHRTTALS